MLATKTISNTCCNISIHYLQICLIVYWSLCCGFCIHCLRKQAAINVPASSASRKNFHFAILFVLIPGLVLKPCLTYLASGVGFAVLIGVEVRERLSKINFKCGDRIILNSVCLTDHSQIADKRIFEKITILLRRIQRWKGRRHICFDSLVPDDGLCFTALDLSYLVQR